MAVEVYRSDTVNSNMVNSKTVSPNSSLNSNLFSKSAYATQDRGFFVFAHFERNFVIFLKYGKQFKVGNH